MRLMGLEKWASGTLGIGTGWEVIVEAALHGTGVEFLGVEYQVLYKFGTL